MASLPNPGGVELLLPQVVMHVPAKTGLCLSLGNMQYIALSSTHGPKAQRQSQLWHSALSVQPPLIS